MEQASLAKVCVAVSSSADAAMQQALEGVAWTSKESPKVDVMIFNEPESGLADIESFRAAHPHSFIVVFREVPAEQRYKLFKPKGRSDRVNMVTTLMDDLRAAVGLVAQQLDETGACVCPICGLGLSAAGLWVHLPLFHVSHPEIRAACPVCGKFDTNIQRHFHDAHIPAHIRYVPAIREQLLYAFALVVCRRPSDGKFLLVQERRGEGFWLPGGALDPGETFAQGATREALEESGVAVTLTGILSLQHTPLPDYNRMRAIFLSEPAVGAREPKTLPDFESVGAVWVTLEEISKPEFPLRGDEPLIWFQHVASGGPVVPLSFLDVE